MPAERACTLGAARSARRSGSSGRGLRPRAPPASAPGSAHLSVPVLARSATRLDSGDAEAQVDAPVGGRDPDADRRTGVARVVVPAPAPDHPERGLRGTERIRARRLAIVVFIVPIPAPLPDISVHV